MLNTFFRESHRFRPHNWTTQSIKPKRISTPFFNEFLWVWIVFQTFRHFFTILCEYESVYDHIFVGIFSFDRMSNHMKRTESTSRLIKSFSDKICWITNISSLFSKVVILPKRHCSRFKPAIQNFRCSFISFTFSNSSISIYIWLMKINLSLFITISVVNSDFGITEFIIFSVESIFKLAECSS